MARLNRGRAKVARVFRSSSATAEFASTASAGLESLALSLRGDALAKIAYSGIRIMYDQMRLRAPVNSGSLLNSIYHWHDDKRSSSFRQIYMAGPNKAKAPHWHLVEYGHELVNVVYKDSSGALIPTHRRRSAPKFVRAHPFIRPTYFGNIDAAQRAMLARAKTVLAEALQG